MSHPSTTSNRSHSDTLALADLLPMVEQVDVEAAALLRARPGRATTTPLSFYADASLVRAEAWLPTHPVTMRYVYLHAAHRVVSLGTPDAILEANRAADFRLTPSDAVAYLRYYLESAGGSGPRRIVEGPDELGLLPANDPDAEASAREQAIARVHPASVQPELGGGMRITATTLQRYSLEAVTFGVKPDGRVTLERATTLVAQAPVVFVR